ncbi:SH3 domain-containing protein [Rhodobacteraceae bacterium D3-12]|nr:SH3 domain-containing protein [Rhodobacteraceae bacterium D3-12]
MRSGPGKEHSVVGKLTRGTEVEVTQDNGTGWVQLRVVDTGEEGWMADFLLVAAN